MRLQLYKSIYIYIQQYKVVFPFSYIDINPKTSVVLGVLAALLEDKTWEPGPTSVRGNWPPWGPPMVSR